jgi:hypothetical protein
MFSSSGLLSYKCLCVREHALMHVFIPPLQMYGWTVYDFL